MIVVVHAWLTNPAYWVQACRAQCRPQMHEQAQRWRMAGQRSFNRWQRGCAAAEQAQDHTCGVAPEHHVKQMLPRGLVAQHHAAAAACNNSPSTNGTCDQRSAGQLSIWQTYLKAPSDCKTYRTRCHPPHLMTCCYCCDLVCGQPHHCYLQARTLLAVNLLCG